MGAKINTLAAKGRLMVLEEVSVKLTPTRMTTLNATPLTLVKAQPAEIIIPTSFLAYKPVGAVAYGGIAAGEDFQLEDADALSLGTLEITGFLDQTTEQYRFSNFAPVTAKATGKGKGLRLKMLTGEVTAGDSPVTITVTYYRAELGKLPTIGD